MSVSEKNFNRILITGSTGFIGRHLIEYLKDNNIFNIIRILVRKNSNKDLITYYQKIIPDLEIRYGNLKELDDIQNAVTDCDAVINLAARVTYRNEPDLFDVNVGGVKNICKAALNSDIKKLVHVSSTASLGFTNDINIPKNESSSFDLSGKGYYYAESKYLADEVVLEYFNKSNLPVVICLPSEVYGEYGWETAKNLIDLIKFPIVWKGGTSVVYVKDVVESLINTLTKGVNGEKYILGGDNLTIEEITKSILEISGKNKKITKIPNFFINHPIKYISIIMEKMNIEPIFDSSVIRYATKYWFVDSSKAKRELGFSPVSPNIIFSKTLKWLMEEEAL